MHNKDSKTYTMNTYVGKVSHRFYDAELNVRKPKEVFGVIQLYIREEDLAVWNGKEVECKIEVRLTDNVQQ